MRGIRVCATAITFATAKPPRRADKARSLAIASIANTVLSDWGDNLGSDTSRARVA